MRLLKIPLYCLIFIAVLSGFAEAQVVCGPTPSPFDFVAAGNGGHGKPGTVVNIPVRLTNQRSLSAFQFYIEYDRSILEPVVLGTDFNVVITRILDTVTVTPLVVDTTILTDTVFYDVYDIDTTGGRMNFSFLSGTNNLSYNLQAYEEVDDPSTDPDLGRFQVLLLPASFDQIGTPAIDSGAGTIFYIPFTVNPAATHLSQALFDFYEKPVFNNAFPPELIACVYSKYADTTGLGDIRPTVQTGNFIVDTVTYDDPVINSFTASPTQVVSGGSVTLNWDVSLADSIVINNSVGRFTSTTGFTTVNPTSNTTYILTAYGNSPNRPTASATVTIIIPGSNIPPVINAVPGDPFTINQGETVSFNVTATDQDATNIITLTTTSLPNNATFSQAVGTGSVTSGFSFTPDYNQSGTFIVTFSANDGIATVTRNVTIIVNEILNDRLFTTSAPGQQPVGGLPGTRNIYFPINMVTSQTVYGVQFDFIYDPIYFEVDSFIVTGRTVDYVVYDNIDQTPGNIRVVTFGLNNEPIATLVDTTAILYAVLSIDSNAAPGDYPVYFENGWESVNPDPNVPSLALIVDSGVIQVDIPGDVNLDKRIDVADLVSVVASIINTFTLSSRQFDVADVIVNDTVDVFDLVGIVNLIYGIPLNPAPPPLLESEFATIALDYDDLLTGGNEMLVVNTETPVDLAAVEIDIEYDPQSVVLGKPAAAADAAALTIRYTDNMTGKMKVILHFSNPFGDDRIKSGFAEMIEIPLIAKEEIISGDKKQLKITKANFATESAARVEVQGVDAPGVPSSFYLSQNYPNPFNPTTNIEFNIESNQHVSLEVYNILGQHVKTLLDSELPAGAHSIEWDATNSRGTRVSSGIYLYRLTVENNTQSKKMLFLK